MLLLGTQGSASAGPTGGAVWILDRQGKLLREAASVSTTWIDPAHGRIFVRTQDALAAHTLADGETLWSVPLPETIDLRDRAWLAGAEDRRHIMMFLHQGIVGLDQKPRGGLVALRLDTGKRTVGTKRRMVMGVPALPSAAHRHWLDDLGSDVRLLYHNDGAHVPPAVLHNAPSNVQLPQRVEALRFHKGAAGSPVPMLFRSPTEKVRAYVPGLAIGWEGSVARHNLKSPTTYKPPSWGVLDFHLRDDLRILLTDQAPSSQLIAYERGTRKHRWRVPWTKVPARIVGRDEVGIWIAGRAGLYEVAVKDGSRRAFLPLPGLAAASATVRVVRAGKLILVSHSGPRRVHAFDPVTGRELWTRPAAEAACANALEAVLITPGVSYTTRAAEGSKAGLVAVTPLTGTVRWRWSAPATTTVGSSRCELDVRALPGGGYVVYRDYTRAR